MNYDLLFTGLICMAAGLLTGFFVGRDYGRKNLLPFMQENRQLRKLLDAPPEQPQYTDQHGVFLGRFHSTLGDDGGYDYDLYLDQNEPQVVIARYGNEMGDFIMVLPDEDTTIEPLIEGIRRAKEAGLA